MRLGGLFLLLILSYCFNPIEPIVEDIPIIDLSEIEIIDPNQLEDLDASLIDKKSLPVAV